MDYQDKKISKDVLEKYKGEVSFAEQITALMLLLSFLFVFILVIWISFGWYIKGLLGFYKKNKEADENVDK